ncbi:phenazine biosynthesis-like domain-containing protein 1 [Pomacea canaliculata]|uniref:phenazine biosynthesis-like domain-containing protein 1 n=1 Tax=Pomacea canaliculata TaxID=400727 RepID=UPI000D739ECC|nr:phenazine biosynthesis-like domain-containing protein 1 [Pomacea canaliculata]
MAANNQTQLKLYTVDAFSSIPFSGNPAAVCLLPLDRVISDKTLQDIAAEMNLSETAYIRLLSDSESFQTSSRFGLRWFTPVAEIKLCGHATLASAHVLFNILGNTSSSIAFETLSGDLIVKRKGNSISMDFPVGKIEKKSEENYAPLIKALGNTPEIVDVQYCCDLRYLLIRFKEGWTRKEFEQWKLDMIMLERSIKELVVLIVTIRGKEEDGFVDEKGNPYDFVSRCFAPWTGVPEDPVTGSAQTILANYWSLILGKKQFKTRQCSKRGGDIHLELDGSRVHIVGQATCVMEATLLL